MSLKIGCAMHTEFKIMTLSDNIIYKKVLNLDQKCFETLGSIANFFLWLFMFSLECNENRKFSVSFFVLF